MRSFLIGLGNFIGILVVVTIIWLAFGPGLLALVYWIEYGVWPWNL